MVGGYRVPRVKFWALHPGPDDSSMSPICYFHSRSLFIKCISFFFPN